MKRLLIAASLCLVMFTSLSSTLYAWEDRGSYYQSDSHRESMAREQADTDRLNRETRQRDEDSHRQQAREYEERRRSEELRSTYRQDRDGSGQVCQSTRYQTVCN